MPTIAEVTPEDSKPSVIKLTEVKSTEIQQEAQIDAQKEDQQEASLHTAGQRQINRIWEFTQAFIALSITIISLFTASTLAMYGKPDAQTAAFVFIYGVANLVIGFYFGRTNHTRVGGIELGR